MVLMGTEATMDRVTYRGFIAGGGTDAEMFEAANMAGYFGEDNAIAFERGIATAACDICEQEFVDGERLAIGGGEITHKQCVAHWFTANFGREGLA